ncbi:MAG: hypothetical protein CMN21_00725 [Rubinisphaera sp.]|nr:hypothetical protein [Rubinisphaera sp.]
MKERIYMSAMEKVAWTELLVSILAVIVVLILYPMFGSNAHAGFAVLGFLVCSLWFIKRRGQKVVIDERDHAIEKRSTQIGVETAWMATFLALIGIVFWTNYFNDGMVTTRLLTWLIWIQFAICYGVKGCVGVLTYRGQNRAS